MKLAKAHLLICLDYIAKNRDTMYGIEMKFTVKTFLDKGYSQRFVSQKLGISCKTVKKYFDEINSTEIQVPIIIKIKKLDKYKE